MNEEFREFYIDTADTHYIDLVLSRLSNQGDGQTVSHFRGITTNPNAMSKVNAHTLSQWTSQLRKICKLLNKWTHGIPKIPELHVQLPNTRFISDSDVAKFVGYLQDNLTEGEFQLCIKISPYQLASVSAYLQSEGVKVNVTGCADYASVLRASSYGVDYASIIPGRMDERKIQSNKHLSYLNACDLGNTKVITGSMRTVRGVRDGFKYGTIPTIGSRVWNKILINKHAHEQFDTILNVPSKLNLGKFLAPVQITKDSQDLTNEFFESMDELGTQAYIGLMSRR